MVKSASKRFVCFMSYSSFCVEDSMAEGEKKGISGRKKQNRGSQQNRNIIISDIYTCKKKKIVTIYKKLGSLYLCALQKVMRCPL